MTALSDRPRVGAGGERLARLHRAVDAVDRVATPPRILAVYGVLLVVGMASHEMWRDEIQAWAIARDSPSLRALADNAAYEGHPLLWHLLLWLLSRLTRDPLAMQALQAATALGTAALVAWAAPFRPAARAAVLLGYFPLYEYGVKARPYGLTMLLVAGVCILACRDRRPLLGVAVLLGLLANTTAFGLLVAGGLAAGIGTDEVLRGVWRNRRRRREAVLAGTLVVAAAVLAVVQVTPPADAPFGAGLDTPGHARGGAEGAFWVVAAALAHLHEATLRGVRWEVVASAVTVAGVGLVVAGAVALARRPAALVLWLTGTGAIVAVAALRFHGGMRHNGHVALLLLAAAWLHGAFRRWPEGLLVTVRGAALARLRTVLRVGVPVGAAGLLAVQLLAGAAALALEVQRPFSGVPPAAERLREAGLDDAPMVGEPEFVALAVTALLDHEAYAPGRGETTTFMRWDAGQGSADDEEVVDAARRLARAEDEDVVVIAGRRLDLPGLGHPPDVEVLDHLDGTIIDEPVHLYVVSPPRA